MKKYNLFNYISVVLIALSLGIMASCEGPAGPAGPQGDTGPQGPEGPAGSDGTPGVAGNMVCVQCHNLDLKATVTSQYDSSIHGTSQIIAGKLLFIYAGQGDSRKSCAICHTSEGFIERTFTGLDTIGAGLALPQHIQCETCHDFHQTLDQENEGPDYAIRKMDPVSLIMTGHTSSIDLGNESNLCVNCHQPREAAPEDDGNGNFYVSNTHYGPHHGPQGTILDGIGGYEVAGSAAYPDPESTTHFKDATCVKCHMHNFNHTFEPSLDACKECHDGITDFDFNGVQSDVLSFLSTLKGDLTTAGLLDANGSPVVGTYPVDQAGALYNYLMIEDDRSEGVHNPAYVKALLKNSIAVFN
jgi:hypothetical protein